MERYEVFELIGEGSFGKVYKGLDKRTREHVALKMISKIGRHEKELISLRQECEIQKGLKHPNIIQMLDSVETADHVIVVTEYAKGDIFELLRREKKLPVRKVQFIAYNLVSALYYLHNHRILHRDIKPQNILIGYDGLAKLCDFGFARTMGINTYMLTSVKGTPLYMAPEIVRSQPYDHNADLWSLGCILFELINGAPPFPTTTVFELVKKIEKEDIKWPLEIDGDCKSFLQGLLIKDPTKRLTWPDLLQHPFVKDCLLGHKPEEKFSLTIALSPSQEAAKEQQREHLQKKLDRYSKLLIKTAKNLAEAQKELKRCSNDMKKSQSSVKTNKTATPTPTPLMSPRQQQQHQYPGSSGSSRNKPTKVQSKSKNNYIPTITPNKTATGKAKIPTEFDEDSDTNSSCETMTSTSSSLSSASEDGQTVILDPRSPIPSPGHLLSPPMSPDYNSNYNPQSEAGAGVGVPGISPSGSPTTTANTNTNRNRKYDGLELDLDIAEFEMGHLRLNDDDAGVKGRGHNPDTSGGGGGGGGGGGVLWKSGALFTLHSFGSEDKPIESEEWIDFVGKTMKEVQENPESLCEKHFLTVLVAPLRNHLAGAVVIEKIATLLAMPFTLSFMKSNLQKKLETIYLEAKVLPNLLYSCKLMVRRRRVERHSLNLKSNDHGHDMVSIMEPEDLDGMGKSMRLIAFLVHLQKEFAVQFCDSVCVLQAFPIFLLFLRLHSKCARLTVDTLSVLCHVLRVLPANSNIVEELLLDYDNFDDDNSEILGMLSHGDKGIQSKAFRLLGYLILYSEKIREKLVRPRSTMLWEILNHASTDPDCSISAAAEFTSDKLQQFIPSSKSSEGSDDADNLAVSQ